MKSKSLFFITLLVLASITSSFPQKIKITFEPIEHATFLIKTENIKILVDPGRIDINKYQAAHNPDLILITHHHGDHFDLDIINKLKGDNTKVIASKIVVDKIKLGQIINNNETTKFGKIKIEAIPMYNTTAERKKFHIKGEGNGYILSIGKERIYISGDTEDISEMRSLKNIDVAFICMNLPYTMTPEQAASAVLEFKPKVVIPYHYRTKDVSNDEILDRFTKIVAANKNISIDYLKWYHEL
jgi:L-ascorbate metabolism protein UlaG (beta-lactamase superfamily)